MHALNTRKKDMHTRTHSWITYTLAYLLTAVIENTFCYLTMITVKPASKRGKFLLSLEDSERQTQCPTCIYGTLACKCVCVHVRLEQVNMRQQVLCVYVLALLVRT